MRRLCLFLLLVAVIPRLPPLAVAQLPAEVDPGGYAEAPAGFRNAAIEPRREGAGISGSAAHRIPWNPVLKQAGTFYGISHGWRLLFQGETRSALKGPYFKDYANSLKGLGGWSDGDPIITNYVGHPMQGSTTMWILSQNDPKGADQEFSFHSKPYWTSRIKGLGFSAAYSTFYELSPIGDAAIGNVGLDPATKGAVDLVVTPSLGMGWHLTEDMVDKYLIRWVERKTGNIAINSLVRIWLNPTRTIANCLRFKTPWRRDTREGIREIRRQREMRALSHRR